MHILVTFCPPTFLTGYFSLRRWVTAWTFHPDGRSSGHSYRGIRLAQSNILIFFSTPHRELRTAVRNNMAELKRSRTRVNGTFLVVALNAHMDVRMLFLLCRVEFVVESLLHRRYFLSRLSIYFLLEMIVCNFKMRYRDTAVYRNIIVRFV